MLSRNHPIILFIDRSGFNIYQDILTNIPKFNFTPDIVANSDVVNKEQFVKLIETFIQINKIVPSSLAVILSDNVIFVKDLKSSVQKSTPTQALGTEADTDKEHKDEVQSFLENVPFEEILAKVIKANNLHRIVAANKDLITTIADVFAGKGSTVESVIPGFMYGQNANFTAGLTPDNVRIILGNTEIFKIGNLLTGQGRIISPQNLESEIRNSSISHESVFTGGEKKPKNPKQYMLIGILTVLLIALTAVYFSLRTPQVSPQKSEMGDTPANTTGIPMVSPANTTILTSTPIPAIPMDIGSIKIRIIQSSQDDQKAAGLKSELFKIGAKDVVSEISEASISERPSIIFSQNISSDLRNIIITEVRKTLPDISALESQDSNSTINIIVGKS